MLTTTTQTTILALVARTRTIGVVRQMANLQPKLIVDQDVRLNLRTQFIQRRLYERMVLIGDISMNAIALNISKKTHALLEPNLHDGTLTGIALPREGNAELIVTELTGKRYRIVLDGVSDFLATDFREGNIILDVTVSQGENVQMADLASLVDVGPDGQRPERYLRAIHERVLRESLYVLELNPSYGCYLIAVAKNISIFREDCVV